MIKGNAGGDQASAPPSVVVVLNWAEELKQKRQQGKNICAALSGHLLSSRR